MVTKTFKIRIPDSIYRYRWSNIKKYADWFFHKPHCGCCGKSLNFKHPEIEHRINNKGIHGRLMLHWYNANKKYICKECLANYVQTGVQRPSLSSHKLSFEEYDTKASCDVCGNFDPAFKYFVTETPIGDVDFRFCTTSWNHDCVCESCVVETLRKGTESSSHFTGQQIDGKYVSVPLNEFGLPVINGKVKFPW